MRPLVQLISVRNIVFYNQIESKNNNGVKVSHLCPKEKVNLQWPSQKVLSRNRKETQKETQSEPTPRDDPRRPIIVHQELRRKSVLSSQN